MSALNLGSSLLHRSHSWVVVRRRIRTSHAAAVGNSLLRMRWSTSGSPPLPPPDRKQKRLPLTLYRQLLQWCQATEAGIPLGAFIEPLTLAPPQLDLSVLPELKEYHDAHKANDRSVPAPTPALSTIAKVSSMLPPKSKLSSNNLNVRIQNTSDLRNLIRAMFRLNSQTATEESRKERIAFAFQTLRSLNELTDSLDDLISHRNGHMDRGDVDDVVKFHIGQVVQHKHERWRGVVVGWEKPDDDDTKKESDEESKTEPLQLSSLTTKKYTASDFLSNVRYEIILDAGDVHMLQAASSFIVSTQDDLETVTDSSLCRIRSAMTSDHFRSFDSSSNTFVANDMLAYEYPADHTIQQQAVEEATRDLTEGITGSPETMAEKVAAEIKRFAQHLETLIAIPEGSVVDEQNGLSLLTAIQSKIASVSSDDIESWPTSIISPRNQGMTMEAEEFRSPVACASARLRNLLNIALEVRDILWRRQNSKEVASQLKFGVGDVVYHKHFGFRGVVVAFDHKPTVDVSRWDGLVDIENPLEKPFYHVIPDRQDCTNVFGSARGLRYVCEDNMEMCHSDSRALTVSLDPDWTRTLSPEGTTEFVTPFHIKFKHGMDIGDNGLTETCLGEIQRALSDWHVASREMTSENNDGSHLSLADLFGLLQATERMEDAIALEEMIKEIFKAHPSDGVRQRLEQGIANVLRGKSEDALQTFVELSKEHSDYAEAWNKIAACQYMLGNMPESLEAAKKSVDLMPRHFQAHNGKGLCEYDQTKYAEAAASFRKSLGLDPWSPVSSKLAACIDVLNRQERTDSASKDVDNK